MSLSDKIERSKRVAEALANYAIGEHKEFVWNHSFQSDLQKIVNNDLMHNNPDNLFEEYKEYFKTKALPTKIIDTSTVFYRGRIGNEVIYGAEDEYTATNIYNWGKI